MKLDTIRGELGRRKESSTLRTLFSREIGCVFRMRLFR